MIGEETKKEMKKVLGEIQDGTFAKNWIAENKGGRGNFLKMRKDAQESLIETTGKELRDKMTWTRESYEE
jgi:ketol-acid reductoisomerase